MNTDDTHSTIRFVPYLENIRSEYGDRLTTSIEIEMICTCEHGSRKMVKMYLEICRNNKNRRVLIHFQGFHTFIVFIHHRKY